MSCWSDREVKKVKGSILPEGSKDGTGFVDGLGICLYKGKQTRNSK